MANGRVVEVETSKATLARGISEELRIDPGQLAVSAQRIGAWAVNAWPIGIQYLNKFGLAISPVVHLDRDSAEMLVDEFGPSEEVSATAFKTIREIQTADNLRPGLQAWMVSVEASGLLTAKQNMEPLKLELDIVGTNVVDVRFDRINPTAV
jgi:hypothetical protein